MKILVVDDEELLVKGIRFNLQNEGYEIIKEKYAERFTLVDGNDTPEVVFNNVYKVIKDKINGQH